MKKFETPHIAAGKGEIAETVLMPGDPLRAKFVAENFLEDAICFNKVRNMLGFTGIYKGEKISVIGSGMGIPSMGIYSHELYNFYGVESIIRIGSSGSISDNLNLGDIIVAMGACTNSNFINQFSVPGTFAPIANYELLSKAVKACKKKNVNFEVGNVISSDRFYGDSEKDIASWKKMGVLAFEMETAGLYANAAAFGKKAVAILTVSDCIISGKSLSSKDREESLKDMIEIAFSCIENSVKEKTSF